VIAFSVSGFALTRRPFDCNTNPVTILLGFLAFALSFIAGYTIVAEREADLWGDDAQAQTAEAIGEVVGIYCIRSPLPIASAAAPFLSCKAHDARELFSGAGIGRVPCYAESLQPSTSVSRCATALLRRRFR
jgi:hypothetical protein